MMSQNRQQQIDRKAAEGDYRVNIKSELEIELLHQKLDNLRESEVMSLSRSVALLTELLHETKDELAALRAQKAQVCPLP